LTVCWQSSKLGIGSASPKNKPSLKDKANFQRRGQFFQLYMRHCFREQKKDRVKYLPSHWAHLRVWSYWLSTCWWLELSGSVIADRLQKQHSVQKLIWSVGKNSLNSKPTLCFYRCRNSGAYANFTQGRTSALDKVPYIFLKVVHRRHNKVNTSPETKCERFIHLKKMLWFEYVSRGKGF